MDDVNKIKLQLAKRRKRLKEEHRRLELEIKKNEEENRRLQEKLDNCFREEEQLKRQEQRYKDELNGIQEQLQKTLKVGEKQKCEEPQHEVTLTEENSVTSSAKDVAAETRENVHSSSNAGASFISNTDSPNSANMKCVVCGGTANGIHYSALTCEGCKLFFRRHSKKKRDLRKGKSHTSDFCEIDSQTRTTCAYCRMKKCLEVGMNVDRVWDKERCKTRKHSKTTSGDLHSTESLDYTVSASPTKPPATLSKPEIFDEHNIQPPRHPSTSSGSDLYDEIQPQLHGQVAAVRQPEQARQCHYHFPQHEADIKRPKLFDQENNLHHQPYQSSVTVGEQQHQPPPVPSPAFPHRSELSATCKHKNLMAVVTEALHKAMEVTYSSELTTKLAQIKRGQQHATSEPMEECDVAPTILMGMTGIRTAGLCAGGTASSSDSPVGNQEIINKDMYYYIMELIILCLKQLINFGKALPGFSNLSYEDQAILIKEVFVGYILLQAAFGYDPKETHFHSFIVPDEVYTMSDLRLGGYSQLISHVMTLIEKISKLKLTKEEQATVLALYIYTPDRSMFSNTLSEALNPYYKQYVNALCASREINLQEMEFYPKVLEMQMDLQKFNKTFMKQFMDFKFKGHVIEPVLGEMMDLPE